MTSAPKSFARVAFLAGFAIQAVTVAPKAQMPTQLQLTAAEVGAAFECAALAAVAGKEYAPERERLLELGIDLLHNHHGDLAPAMLTWLQPNGSSPTLESMGPDFWAGVLLMQFAAANASMSTQDAEQAFYSGNCVVVR